MNGFNPEAISDFPEHVFIPKQEPPRQEINHQPVKIPPNQLERASKYLTTCDPAIQGQGGHNKLLYAADRMVNGFDLTNEQAYTILANEFNPRCVPPWDLNNEKDAKDFCRKIDEARKLRGKKQPGWLLIDEQADRGEPNRTLQSLLHDNRPRGLQTSDVLPISPDAARCYEELVNPPGLLGEICQWINTTSLIPQPVLSLGAALTFLGSLLGRKVKDSLGSRTNLYCMGVAPSSAGKNHAITCIRNLSTEAFCTCLLGGEYVASDAAIEERMSRNPATLFLWDEIGYLLSHVRSGISKNHAQVVSLLMKLYSSAQSIYLGREYAEKDKQRIICQPCCCIYGTATPESFSKGLSPEQLQDGWLSRCLVFYSDARPTKQRNVHQEKPPESIVKQVRQWHNWQPEWPDGTDLTKYIISDANGRYQERPPYQITIPETEEASKIFIDFDNETIRIGDKHPELATLWKKGEENARRISLPVACSNCFEQPILDAQVADYACSLVRFLLRSFSEHIAPNIVGTEIERRKRKIVQVVAKFGAKGISNHELTRRTHWTDAQGRAKLLSDLLATGEISIIPNAEVVRYRV